LWSVFITSLIVYLGASAATSEVPLQKARIDKSRVKRNVFIGYGV
jgi:hypothetical protein